MTVVTGASEAVTVAVLRHDGAVSPQTLARGRTRQVDQGPRHPLGAILGDAVSVLRGKGEARPRRDDAEGAHRDRYLLPRGNEAQAKTENPQGTRG